MSSPAPGMVYASSGFATASHFSALSISSSSSTMGVSMEAASAIDCSLSFLLAAASRAKIVISSPNIRKLNALQRCE